MTISSIGNKILSYTLSGLGNNSDSIIPMATKDLISDYAIVHTYKKNGTPDDVREKAIEEFGTAAVWLFGIPTLKQLINKTIYPLFKLDPNLDLRIFQNKDKFAEIKESLKGNIDECAQNQKIILETLGEKAKFLGKYSLPFTNKQLYTAMFLGKFAAATIVSAFALNKIIRYKQKTTQNRIKKDQLENNTSKILVNESIKKSSTYANIKNSTNKPLSFTSHMPIEEFMYNPILNTLILDGVITTTRVIDARKGERKEVGLKEGFQLLFIYGLAKPLQIIFEKIGSKLKLPIACDAKLIFDEGLKEKLEVSKETIASLKKSKNLTKDLLSLDANSAVADVLDKNGIIRLIQDKKQNIKSIDRFNYINEKSVLKELSKIEKLSNNIGNIKGIKTYKLIAVLGNVAIAAWAMGVLQPLINIWMRKKLNNGDNANPAIRAQENMAKFDSKNLQSPFRTHQG